MLSKALWFNMIRHRADPGFRLWSATYNALVLLAGTAGKPTQMMSKANVTNPFTSGMKTAPGDVSGGHFSLVAGTGFEPATSGL